MTSKKMNAKQVLIFGVTLFLELFGPAAMGEAMAQQHIQIAEIEVDPAQLESYKAAVQEQIGAAIRLEPGVLVLYSVSSKENPAHVTVFEIYRDRDAYVAHLPLLTRDTRRVRTFSLRCNSSHRDRIPGS